MLRGMKPRDEIIAKVVKMVRLARGAGTEAEAHTALTLAQRLMYAHGIAEHELTEPDIAQPIEDAVIDATGKHVGWKEYLARASAPNKEHVLLLGHGVGATDAGERVVASDDHVSSLAS